MSLRSKVVSGLFWTGGTRILGQVITWGITIVVMRLLHPSDYGLLAMATFFGAFLFLLSEAGLSQAVVQATQLDDATLRQIFGIVILLDVGLFLLQYAIAPLVGAFFEEEGLVPIMRVLALQFLVNIFVVIPFARLDRELDFKGQALIRLAGSVIGGLCALGLALAGYGVWSLVWAALVTAVWHALAINCVAPFMQRPIFSLKGIHKLIVVGGQITGARILWYVYSQADIFIAGKVLGKEALGFYSVSMHLASLPVQRISAIMTKVVFPAFAETQHEATAVRSYMLKAVRTLSFFAFPVFWGMSSVATEIVDVLLGEKWAPAVLPLELLSIVMPFSILSIFLNTAFQGIGRSDTALMNVLIATLIMPPAFLIGVHWGLLGLSLAWIVGFLLVFFLNLKRMLPLIGLQVSDVVLAGGLAAAAAAGLYVCVAAARQILPADIAGLIHLIVLVAVGTSGYLGFTALINRGGMLEVIALVRKRSADS